MCKYDKMFRLPVPGSSKTKRLRKKREKYLATLEELGKLYAAIMKHPFFMMSAEEKALVYKYRKLLCCSVRRAVQC